MTLAQVHALIDAERPPETAKRGVPEGTIEDLLQLDALQRGGV